MNGSTTSVNIRSLHLLDPSKKWPPALPSDHRSGGAQTQMDAHNPWAEVGGGKRRSHQGCLCQTCTRPSRYTQRCLYRFCALGWGMIKELRHHSDAISIFPELPPALRPMKRELIAKRKDMPQTQKSKYNLRYLRQWPYVVLSGPEKSTIVP